MKSECYIISEYAFKELFVRAKKVNGKYYIYDSLEDARKDLRTVLLFLIETMECPYKETIVFDDDALIFDMARIEIVNEPFID